LTNLSWDLLAVLSGDVGALGFGNLAGGGNAVGPWNRGAPGNGDGPRGLDWNLVAHLAVDSLALLAIAAAGLSRPLAVAAVSLRAFLKMKKTSTMHFKSIEIRNVLKNKVSYSIAVLTEQFFEIIFYTAGPLSTSSFTFTFTTPNHKLLS
jgi:hypothetical protein